MGTISLRHPLVALATCATLGAVAACHTSAATPPAPKTWHVEGGFIRDADGRAVIMHGANIAGANKTAPYWDGKTQADWQRARDDWGFNAARLLVVWAAIEPQRGVYDDAFLDAVATRVEWAAKANMLVVLDMHEDVYGEGFGFDGAPRWTCDASHYANFKPIEPWFLNSLDADVTACVDGFWRSDDLHAHYKEAWRRLGARLAGYDNVVGFDAINEPYWGSVNILDFESTELQPFYEELVPAVRTAAPTWLAFLEPSAARNLGGSSRLAPFTFDGVVYAPHSYDRDAESGKGFDPAHRDALLANVASLAAEARGLSAALWIGEYGSPGGAPGITEYMTAQYDAAGAAAAGNMVWSYDASANYGLLNPDGTEKASLLGVVVRPYPERVAGDPVSYAFDAATKTFTLTYHAQPGITAPTILSIAPRLYPAGFAVDCGGCAAQKTAGGLVVTSPPPGDPAVLRVHP
jgi:endoglycosylceramidase